MQVSSNYQNNTNFTGGHFIVPPHCQKRFMREIRNTCSVSDLIKIRNTFKNGLGDRTKIYLEDLGYIAGHEADGHLCGTINGKEYLNSWPLWDPATWSIPKFIAKLARKGDKAEIKLKTKNTPNIIEKILTVKAYKKKKALEKILTELECTRTKNTRKEGKVTEQEQKRYLLGEIYKLIGGKRR